MRGCAARGGALSGRSAGPAGGHLPAREPLDDFGDPEHPVNQVAVVRRLGRGASAASARRPSPTPRPTGGGCSTASAVPPTRMDRLHATGFLGEAVDSASLWTTLFKRAGVDLLCPFLDSRMLRLALNLPAACAIRFRRPKDLLKRALARVAPPSWRGGASSGSASRSSSGWRRAGNCGRWSIASAPTTSSVRRRWTRPRPQPTWFLYSLLCYDLWHKLFIDRSLPLPEVPRRRRRLRRAAGWLPVR